MTDTLPSANLASRLDALSGSPTLRINEQVRQMWSRGERVYHLGFGESRFPLHPLIAEALKQHAGETAYLPVLGLPSLREAVAAFYERCYGLEAAPEQVVIAPGSKALLFALLLALDGNLLLPRPAWVSYRAQAALVGKEVRWVVPEDERQYGISVTALQAARYSETATRSKPDLLLLNSPHNPTGQLLSAPSIREVVAYCREQGLVVLSDEIYALVTHDRARHIPIAREYPEGTVTLGGLSKHLSLGGWRLGVALLPPTPWGRRLMQALRTVAGEIWTTAAAPVQYAARVAYSGDPEIVNYIDECAYLHAIRTRYLWQHLNNLGIFCPAPAGAFYLYPSFDRWREQLSRRGIHTSDDLALCLLERFRVATLPGTAFGAPPEVLSLRLSTSYVDLESTERAQALLDLHRSGAPPKILLTDHHPMLNEAIRSFGSFVEWVSDEVPAQ